MKGATVFSHRQTVPDHLRVLLQVGSSPFDCAGRRSMDQIRMACKRSAVRARLAPPGQPYNSNNLKRDFERLVALPGAALEPGQPPLATSSALLT